MQFTSKTLIFFVIFIIFSTITLSAPAADGVKNDNLLERSDELSKRDDTGVISGKAAPSKTKRENVKIDRRGAKRLPKTGFKHSKREITKRSSEYTYTTSSSRECSRYCYYEGYYYYLYVSCDRVCMCST